MSNCWICEAFNILPMLSELNLALLFHHHLLDFGLNFYQRVLNVQIFIPTIGFVKFHV